MEKDITRRAVERAARIVNRAGKRLKERIPYGPSKVMMSPAELRRTLRETHPDVVRQILGQLETEQIIELLMPMRRT